MLGHASAAMTLDRYGHLFGDDLDAIADRLDAAARGFWCAPSVPRNQDHDGYGPCPPALTWGFAGALGRIRTCDTRFRKPMLYPLSYEG
jgi:hypothetical protein